MALGCLSVCLPIILIGTVYYHYAERTTIRQIEDEADSSLMLSQDRVEKILQTLELDSYRLAASEIIRKSLYAPHFDEDLILHGNIMKMLEITKNADDYINDVVYYNQPFGAVLSNNYGYVDAASYPDGPDIREAIRLDKKARWVYLPMGKKRGSLSYVQYLPVIPNDREPNGFVMIYASTQEINNYLVGSLGISLQASVLVLDEHNRYLLGTGEFAPNQAGGAPVPGTALQTVAANSERTGHFFQNKTLYAYSKSPMGRTYLLEIPYSEVTESLKWNRMFFTTTLCFFLSLGLLLTLAASFSAYMPIRQLLNLGKRLYKENASPQNEISFIRQCLNHLKEKSDLLMQTIDHLDPGLVEQFLQKLMEENSIIEHLIEENDSIKRIAGQSKYVILIVTVSNLHKDRRFNAKDNRILKFVIQNVMKELLDKDGLSGSVVHDSKLRAIAVLYGEQDTSSGIFLQQAKQYARQISAAIRQYLKLTVFVGIGNIVESFEDMPRSYQEALDALQRRIYRDDDAVLFIADSLTRKGVYYYPFHLKQAVVDALISGDEAKAGKSLEEYIRALRISESYEIVSHGYHALLYAVMELLERETDYEAEYLQWLDLRLFDQLQERKTPGEVYDWFAEYLFPMYQGVRERHSNVHTIVQRVSRYIHDHACEDLSLSSIADMVGVSPSHLSRLFKKEMGVSFLNYVLECKIHAAMILMKETDLSISEIAAKIGYSERNFSRVFQKYVHMTPGQYKSMQP